MWKTRPICSWAAKPSGGTSATSQYGGRMRTPLRTFQTAIAIRATSAIAPQSAAQAYQAIGACETGWA